MKLTMLRTIILFATILFNAEARAQKDCLPVKKLQTLYESNKNFRLLIDSTFSHVHDLPGNTANPWKNKNINDLYRFLNEWFYALPSSTDALDKILEFSFLYYRNPYGLKLVKEEPGLSWTNFFVEEQGRFMDSQESVGSIKSWLADNSLHNEDYVVPSEGYKSFNEFFTRNLKPGARKIDSYDDSSVIVSPVDGVLNWIENNLQLDSAIAIKGRMVLNLRQIFNNSSVAEKFVGGTALSFVLLPDNYHHFHSPVSGVMVESNQNVGHELFGTQVLDIVSNGNPGQHLDFSIFENYKHGYFVIKTENFGYVAVIPVGLETIGSVVFEQKFKNINSEQKQTDVLKGEKLGHFQYGGSLVMVLFQKNKFKRLSVKQGQQVGKFAR
ncbi:MAG: phosphatidylserine decarboxylase [Bacteroidetes bacterium]|nr:phosphatidylserine decarboxylase [Bacteroidota bacterium]